MARTLEFDVNEVLEKSMQLFWQKGFGSTSMSDIYAATKLKPGSVYASFKSKDELFRLAFERYTKYFKQALEMEEEGLAAIERWLKLQAQLSTEDPQRKGCLLINTILERSLHTEATRAVAQGRIEEMRRFFFKNVTIGKARNEISNQVNTEISADALLGATISVMALGRAGADNSTIWNVAKSAVNALKLASC